MFTVEVHNYTVHHTRRHWFTTHTPTPTHICTPHTNTPIHILVIPQHMHTPLHTNTYLYTSLRRSVCFFCCAASCGSQRKMVYSCTPWLTYKSEIKDTRSCISLYSCEIVSSLSFSYSKQAKWDLATRLQTYYGPSHKNSLARRNDGLTCVLMEPWSSSWSRLRSGGSIWTVAERQVKRLLVHCLNGYLF